MNIETNKYLGGVGALLIVIGPIIGFFGSAWAGLLDLVGLILVLIAMKGLADIYNEQGIFNNALYGIIAIIVGAVAFVGALIATVLTAIASGFSFMDPSTWEQLTDISALWNVFGTAITGIIISLIVLFVFFIVAFILIRKSLDLLASKSGVGMFGTAGLLMLIGAVLTIIAIGLVLVWIGFILLIVAFFSIKPQKTMPASTTPQQPPT